MFKKIFRFIVIVLFLAFIVVVFSLYMGGTRWKSANPTEVSIRPGSSLRAISHQLEKAGTIGTPTLFEYYVRVKGLANKMKSGTYDFPEGTTMLSAVDKLAKGDVRQYEFTIIEGWSIKDIAEGMKGKPYLANDRVPNEFVRFAKDKEFMKELGFENIPSLEGYLFPDTYKVDFPLEAKPFIKRLVDTFKGVWDDIAGDKKKITNDKMSQAEIVTLASIVEKETGVPGERPLVSGVFLNRLKDGIALQSDPTIIYGLKNYDGNIRKRDIKNPHRYNTYVHRGLPPGAICNPGRASLEAVFNPQVTDYLYFVSKNDGSHHFSESLTQHLRAVRRYQVLGEGRKK